MKGLLLSLNPEQLHLLLDFFYEETIQEPSAHPEGERSAQNNQEKMNCQSRFQGITEVGSLRAHKPWALAEQKTVSHLYLMSIPVEGQQIFK